ncbi:MAG: NnrS family protein [Xanthomonadaceae bacterium]|nr:NnrS family protein [Xanthomonadaceae bacterium]MDE2258123.1 NnrS family protein [Xanthomonadaceae bacterium]
MDAHIGQGSIPPRVRQPAGAASAPSPAAAVPAGFPTLAELPRVLAAAPHRMMFFGGATALLLTMLWWACFLGTGYYGHAFPAAPVPGGWAHAVFTQYGMLAMFIFGFLLTVFPRWMGQPALPKRAYVPVFAGMFGGYLLAHIGLLDLKPLLVAGLTLMLGGWIMALRALGSVLHRNGWRDRHALSCFSALCAGGIGLACFLGFALGAPWQCAIASIKIGTFGLLLPIFFTVCHRMIPFFSANVVGPGYRPFKPGWSLPVLWTLTLSHLGLESVHRYDLLFLADAPLAAFFAYHWIGWQPWKCLRPGLLAALYIAFTWLPTAFVLFTVQSLILRWTGEFTLGRAPVHALTVGFFASMLVAMVTRVTHGHSGRPLQMGAIAWLTFGLLQGVVLIRIGAELTTNTALWLVVAAFGWLVAFTPWVLRALWIYLTPRRDGIPG